MPVYNGQDVSAEVTNPAFLDAMEDDFAEGVIGFKNTTDPNSGPFIENIQKCVNRLFTATAVNETTADGMTYGAPASTITDGQSHQLALKTLADKFEPIAGHRHDGTPGGGRQVAAANLTSVPLRGYIQQGTDLIGVTGSTKDISSVMAGKTPSSGASNEGVVVLPPYNKIMLRRSNGIGADDAIIDGAGNIVYGRITNLGATWTLSFYVDISGTETAYNFSTSIDLRWYYQALFNPMTNPPIYSEFALVPSDNATQDVVTATETQEGKVLLANLPPASITSTNVKGTSGRVAHQDHSHEGTHSMGVYGSPTQIVGDVQLEAGDNIVLAINGQRIKITTPGAVGKQDDFSAQVNGINMTYGPFTTLPSSHESLLVFVDGVLIEKTLYTVTGSYFALTFAPQLGQSVYVFYLTTGVYIAPPTPTGVLKTEFRTLTAGEITAKKIVLGFLPATPEVALVDIIGGTSQEWAVDYTITGNELSWSGYVLDGVLSAGDRLRVHYIT